MIYHLYRHRYRQESSRYRRRRGASRPGSETAWEVMIGDDMMIVVGIQGHWGVGEDRRDDIDDS